MFGLFFATCLAGCGDPAAGRLEPGDRVLLIPGFMGEDGRPSPTMAVTAEEEPLYRIVAAGTEAKVVRDDRPIAERHRDVTIRVVEGRHEGLTGTVPRGSCRPVR